MELIQNILCDRNTFKDETAWTFITEIHVYKKEPVAWTYK